MTIFRTTQSWNNRRVEKISRGELAYICSRNLHRAHDFLLQSIRSSGLTQRQLAELSGIDETVISRLLRRPRNVELNTLSKLVYASCGAALNFEPAYRSSGVGSVFRGRFEQRASTSNDNFRFRRIGAVGKVSNTEDRRLDCVNA